jgi:acyl-CoA thioesterase II
VGDFAIDTAIEGSEGHYVGRLSRDWEIWGPNGGYLAAIALRAAGAATGLARPAAFTCHVLSVAEFDAVDLTVTILRAAKRAASVRVSMTQASRPILEALAWVVDDGLQGLEHDDTTMPSVPPPDALRSTDELIPEADKEQRHRFWANFEVRPLAWVPWHERTPQPPVWREWYRFRPRAIFDDPFVDAARSLLLIDTISWPAACLPHVPQTEYVAPSLDVSVQFHRAAPSSPWLLCEATAPIAQHGLIGGQTRVWSAEGHLLASGIGQLLCRPSPAPR